MKCEICHLEGHDMSAHYDENDGYGQDYMDDPYSELNDPSIMPDGSQSPILEANAQNEIESDEYRVAIPEQNLHDNVKDMENAFPTQKGKLGIAQDLMTLAQAAQSGDSDTILNAVEQFSKSQLVRFMDITIIGPLLLFWAWKGKLSKVERGLMGLIGAGTVIYNGRNYLRNKQIIQPAEIAAIKQELVSTKLSGR